jgi:hypothetical protein
MRPRICISAGLRFSVTNSGTVRRRITPKPCGSTLQSMTSSVSGHKCSPLCSIRVAPPSPARKTIAAAPSPNRLTAMMLALVNSSWRSAGKHSSTATSSTLVPGRACARRSTGPRRRRHNQVQTPAHARRQIENPCGGRRMRRDSAWRCWWSKPSPPCRSPGERPAFASAFPATSAYSASAPSRKAAVRSGQPRGSRYHSNGFTP